ncbi:MAG: efflux RND transporter periplasmic adaptor subunit [Actinobacteria bacterium]|nr:efflux RND transporter periplasmic adaptor subunit [Actinomycetota bacterium]
MSVGWSARGRTAAWLSVLSVLLVACTGDDIPVVEVAEVGAGSVTQTISAPAVVEAADRQPVTASVPGVVAELPVDDGEAVKAGDVVIRLVSDEVELALEQAQAAEAAVTASRTGVSVAPPGDAAVAAARESVAELDADVQPDLAQARQRADEIDDHDERAKAHKTIALLERSYHELRDALLDAGRAAAAQQNAVAASFASALDQALAQATAGQVAQAATAADAAAAQADDLELVAPFDGVVALGRAATSATGAVPEELGAADALAGGLGSIGAEQGGSLRVGSLVSPGQTVFTVFDLSQLFVTADVDEIDAPQLAVGQPADVLLDAFPDQTFAGEVANVALEAETSPTGGVAYPARIQLLDVPDDDRLRLGMTASAEITTETVRSDLVVPARAVVRRDGGQAVFAVRDGRAQLVPVEIVALGEQDAAVQAPELRRDDQVIVAGYEDLTDRDAVRIDS